MLRRGESEESVITKSTTLLFSRPEITRDLTFVDIEQALQCTIFYFMFLSS